MTNIAPDPLGEDGIAGFARRLRRGETRAVDVVVTVRPPGDDGALVVGAPTVCGEGHPLAGLVT